MASVTATAQMGSVKTSGGKQVSLNTGTADVTVTFDNTKIKLKSELLAACRAIADHFGSDQLK